MAEASSIVKPSWTLEAARVRLPFATQTISPLPEFALNLRSPGACPLRSEEHTSELQSRLHLVCRLLLEKKKQTPYSHTTKIHNNKSYTYSADVTNLRHRLRQTE